MRFLKNNRTWRAQTMAEEKRKKTRKGKLAAAWLSEQEHARVLAESNRTGRAISDRIRSALLDDPAPRARPRPTINRAETARLIAALGETAEALRAAASTGDQNAVAPQIDAAHRDIAAICSACLQALGRNR